MFLQDTPVAVEVLAWGITLLLVAILIRAFMRKVIRERKRYLYYSQTIKEEMDKLACSNLHYSAIIPFAKPIKLSTVFLLVIVVLVILSLVLELGIIHTFGGELHGNSAHGTLRAFVERLLGPFFSGIILLIIMVVSMCLVWAFGKIKNRKKRKEKFTMRVRVIKNKGER